MSGTPLTKFVRLFHPTLVDLGYELKRSSGGHFVYARDGFPQFVLSSTPNDPRAFANGMAILRRRHPNAGVFRQRKSSRPKRKTARNRQPNRALRVAAAAEGDMPAPRAIRPGSVIWRKQRCRDCAYPWTAECVAVQPCPHCGSSNTTEERAA